VYFLLFFPVFAATHSRLISTRPLTAICAPCRFSCPITPISRLHNPFKMNTCKSVSKQMTLTTFRMNTYEKHRGRGVLLLTGSLFQSTFTDHEPVSLLFAIHTNSPSRKSFICHSYENTGGVHQLFPKWNPRNPSAPNSNLIRSSRTDRKPVFRRPATMSRSETA
jgi:hypothetical protein